jgi:hypothetical protein
MGEEATRAWTLKIKFYDKQSKRESVEVLHFPDRESAAKVDDMIAEQVRRGLGAVIQAESPDGARVTFQASQFQRTVLERYWSGIG